MLTVIVPIYKLDNERKRNLYFIYERLSSLNFKLIFGIQITKNDNFNFDYFNKFNANIEFLEKYDYFNKSFIFNSCLELVDTKFVLLLDADVYFNFSETIKQIDENDEIIKPFSECSYLTEELTKDFILKKSVEITPDLKKISALGGGAIIIRTDIIKEKKLYFDENFNGWGWEDIDFGDLIRFNCLKIKTLEQIAVHLYHKPSVVSNINFNYYNQKDKLKKLIVHVVNYENEKNTHISNSIIKYKTKDVLPINCSDADYLNNDNFKFSYIKNENGSFCLNNIIQSSFPFLLDNGWVIFTESNYEINEHIYPEIINFNGDYIEFYGCSLNNSEFSPSLNMNGFAIRKKIWKEKNVPKLMINGDYWAQTISHIFSDCKKKIIRNQIKSKFSIKKTKTHSEFNLISFNKSINRIVKKEYDITLFTPSGGRPDCLKRCSEFIRNNKTNLKVQWIIVNDYNDEHYEFATDMIYNNQVGDRKKNPIGSSLKLALKYIKSDFVLFIEDDDWYSSDYIQYYYNNLQKCSLFGQGHAKYYNVKNRSYEIRPNSTTASLCQTGITTELLIEKINCFDDIYAPFNDMELWVQVKKDKILELESNKCVGIKGSNGRPGLGFDHDNFLRHRDLGLSKLKEWVGLDFKLYENYFDQAQTLPNEKFYDSKDILYFAPFAPDFDMSSGGNRLLKILEILKEDLEFNVYFMCNACKDEKHMQVLKNKGINCYIRNENYLIDHLESLKSINFKYVIFSWHDIASQYLDIVKKMFPNIKIIVDSVDIHWKRELRGVKQNLLNYSDLELISRKEEEKKSYSNADVVFAITHDDKKDLCKEIENINIKILSNIHDKKDFIANGNDIIFIGNYLHTPNIEAAIRSISIYKEFANTDHFKSIKNKPKLYIVGPNVSIKIKLLEDENIIIKGHVDNLDQFFETIKVCICPLTWGAGIKGKICDCASRGILILTSDIGNEGINLEDEKSGFIANTNEEFVDKLKTIYSSETDEIALKGRDLINQLTSKDAAISVLKHTLSAKPITIVIVTHNKAEVLKRCILSILKKTEYPNYKIVIVDNASTDKTEDLVLELQSKNPEKIDYYKNKTNDFFIIPNNKIMLNEKYKNTDICLLNDDMEILSKCWLTHLYSAAYSECNVCCVGGKILHPDGKIAEAGSELYQDGSGRNIARGLDSNEKKYNHIRYVGYVSGCLMYMRRDAINKIGVFDEDFAPMYYEDSEWQYRAHTFNLKTIYNPNVCAIHHEKSDEFKPMKIHQDLNKNKFSNKYKNIDIEKYN